LDIALPRYWEYIRLQCTIINSHKKIVALCSSIDFCVSFSGGHTAEMMNIITELQKDRFTPRYYVAALTDNMSLQKAQVYEKSLIQVEIIILLHKT
jgi:hypothetical protein